MYKLEIEPSEIMNKHNIYCMVDETVLCCECGNCPPDDEEDLYPFSNEEE